MRDAGAQVRPDHATARRSEGDAPSRCLGNGRKRSISAAPLQNTRQTDLVGSLGLKSDRLLGMPCRRRGADMQEMGPYQVVIGKEVAQDLLTSSRP